MYRFLKILSTIKRLFIKKSRIFIDDKLYKKVEAICNKYGLFMSTIVEALLRQYLIERDTAFGLREARRLVVERLKQRPKNMVSNLDTYGLRAKHTGFYRTPSFNIAVDREQNLVFFEGLERYPVFEEITKVVNSIYEDELKDKKITLQINIPIKQDDIYVKTGMVKVIFDKIEVK